MHDRRLQIVWIHRITCNVKSKIVRLTVRVASLDPTTSKPASKCIWMVITTKLLFVGDLSLYEWGSAEFSRPDYQSVSQQSSLFQIPSFQHRSIKNKQLLANVASSRQSSSSPRKVKLVDLQLRKSYSAFSLTTSNLAILNAFSPNSFSTFSSSFIFSAVPLQFVQQKPISAPLTLI